MKKTLRRARCWPNSLLLAVLSLGQLTSTQAQIDLEQCIEALHRADISNNNRLNRDPEYIEFLNEVSDNSFGSVSYEELPEVAKANFETYMGFSGVVDITGTKPGSYPTSQQLRMLESFCEATMVAVKESTIFSAPKKEVEEEDSEPELKATVSRESRGNVPTTGEASEENDLKQSFSDAEIADVQEIDGADNVLYVTAESLAQQATSQVPTLIPTDPEFLNATDTEWNNTLAPSDEGDIEPIGWDEEETTMTTTETPVTITSSPSERPTQSFSPTFTALPSPAPSTSPTISLAPTRGRYRDCQIVMKFSDIDGDKVLNELEYVWFLNDNWENPYPGAKFDDLPQILKDNFLNFASNTTNEIDISGLDAADEDNDFLDRVCEETENAILQAAEEGGGSSEHAAMSTFKKCLEVVTEYDLNSDSQLDEIEFTELLHKLSNSKFGSAGFADLPDVLQENFDTIAGHNKDTLDLVGAKQGEELTGKQEEKLAEVCMGLSFALDEAIQELTEDESSIFDTGDTLTMLEFADCFMKINTYDKNEDLGLNQVEYTEIVNHLAMNHFDSLTFTELPTRLQENFFRLATADGDIDIEGSAPEATPGSVQQKYLEEVCIETISSIKIVLKPASPAHTPITSTSVEPVIIHSSFNIYSDVYIAEEELTMGKAREHLEEAYKSFVMKVMDQSTTAGVTQRAPRHLEEEYTDLKPLISLHRDSPTIYHLQDLVCAGSQTQETTCKTAFARYNITILDGSDPGDVYDKFVKMTQRSIDSGILQSELERIDPGSLLSVIGSSQHLVYDESSSALDGGVTTESDKAEDNESGSGSGKKRVALVAVAFACLAIGAIIGLVIVRYRRKLAEMKQEESDSFADALFGYGKTPSDTESKEHDEKFVQEEETTCSERDNAMRSIFRSCGSDADDASRDAAIGPMEVVDVGDGVVSAQNEVEAGVSKHLYRKPQGGSVDSFMSDFSSIPPLTRPAVHNETSNGESVLSENDLSFAFRRYALNGAKKNRGEQSTQNAKEEEEEEDPHDVV